MTFTFLDGLTYNWVREHFVPPLGTEVIKAINHSGVLIRKVEATSSIFHVSLFVVSSVSSLAHNRCSLLFWDELESNRFPQTVPRNITLQNAST